MKIELSKLIPFPIIEIPHEDSEMWEVDSVVFTDSELCYIQAPSGKGKTSLLSILYGIRSDFKGKLSINGENAALFDAFRWSKIRKNSLSYIFQGLELFDDLSALDNIQLKNSQRHYKTESEIRQMAQNMEVEGFLGKKCGILSYGQRQRIAIIRALCQPIRFLLADEPFSHLDSKSSQLAFDTIHTELKAQNAGLLLTGLQSKPVFDLNKIIRL